MKEFSKDRRERIEEMIDFVFSNRFTFINFNTLDKILFENNEYVPFPVFLCAFKTDPNFLHCMLENKVKEELHGTHDANFRNKLTYSAFRRLKGYQALLMARSYMLSSQNTRISPNVKLFPHSFQEMLYSCDPEMENIINLNNFVNCQFIGG